MDLIHTLYKSSGINREEELIGGKFITTSSKGEVYINRVK